MEILQTARQGGRHRLPGALRRGERITANPGSEPGDGATLRGRDQPEGTGRGGGAQRQQTAAPRPAKSRSQAKLQAGANARLSRATRET